MLSVKNYNMLQYYITNYLNWILLNVLYKCDIQFYYIIVIKWHHVPKDLWCYSRKKTAVKVAYKGECARTYDNIDIYKLNT